MSAEGLLEVWLRAHNQCDFELLCSVLHVDARILAHVEGRSRPARLLEGRDAIGQWFGRMPAEAFVFRALSEPSEVVRDPELPRASTSIAVTYLVEAIAGEPWRNEGVWLFHIEDALVVGLRQTPNDLEQG